MLAEPDTEGADLYAAAVELRDSFVRGEHLIAPAGERAGAAGHRARPGRRGGGRAGRLRAYSAAPWAPYPEPDAAIEAYRKADRAGSAAAPEDPDLLLLTGYVTHQGYGRPRDEAAAVLYHRAAAEHGSDAVAFELSVLYATGRGVDPDPAAALDWYGKAAGLRRGPGAGVDGLSR